VGLPGALGTLRLSGPTSAIAVRDSFARYNFNSWLEIEGAAQAGPAEAGRDPLRLAAVQGNHGERENADDRRRLIQKHKQKISDPARLTSCLYGPVKPNRNRLPNMHDAATGVPEKI
jgi:hypothetical protein